jgi:sugar lactone lactonase YvrE
VARFNQPYGLASDGGGSLYLADYNNHKVRKVTPANGYFPVGAPNGSAPSEKVQLSNADGYYSDTSVASEPAYPYMIYREALPDGATGASKPWAFDVPAGVSAFDFTVTGEANTATKASPPTAINVGSPDAIVRTLAGSQVPGYADGPAANARFNNAIGLAADSQGNVYVGDGNNSAVRRISPDGFVSTVAGNGTSGYADGTGNNARFSSPVGVAVTADGKTLFVSDFNNNRIRRIALKGDDPTKPENWTVSTVAGIDAIGGTDGDGNAASFYFPQGIACDPSGTNLYVAEAYGNRVRRIRFKGGDPTLATSWSVSRIAGSSGGTAGATDGSGSVALFSSPRYIARDPAGNLFLTDLNNHLIRKIQNPNSDTSSTVTTLAGSAPGSVDGEGAAAQFSNPFGIAADSAGNLYVAEQVGHKIRRISPAGRVTTLAGTGTPGYANGPGNTAQFYSPIGMAVDGSGNVYVSDGSNYGRILIIQRLVK